MKVKINYNIESNKVEIIPEDFKLAQLRGISSYIKVAKGYVVSPELAEIPLDGVDVVDTYNKIKRIFEREFNCEIESNLSAQEKFSRAEEEAKRFAEFSQKAKDIRDNIIEEKEFSDFCNVLADTSFKRSLMPYQLLAAYHIAFSQNACNFSVPGSGKTSTVLAAYEYLLKSNNDKRVNKLVVVGPLSAFIAWKMEYVACFGRSPKCQEIRGGISKKEIEQTLMVTNPDVELVIISYGSIHSNYEAISFFLNNNRCMVVLDEAHRIKKVADDAQSNYVLSLSPLAKSRIVLTGTPAANSYVDLYNLFRFIWPYNNIIGYSVAQLASMSSNPNDYRVDDVINRISPFFIRVKKSDLDLPKAVFEEPLVISMSPIQEEIYRIIEKIAVNAYETGGVSDDIKRAAAIRLRQAASNPSLLLKAIDEEYDPDEEVGSVSRTTADIFIDEKTIEKIRLYKSMEEPNKFYCVKKLITDLLKNNEKAIIWCEFVGTCEYLSEYFSRIGINNRVLYGKCKQEEREGIIAEFLQPEGASFNVIIANPHAVGESISLHTVCHNAIYLEQGFNAGVYMQSKDRIHRVGLSKDTITRYYYIQSADTVDHVAYDRVLIKESRMLELIESREIPLLANIDYEDNSNEDIKAIIKDYYERRNRTI